MKIVFYFIKNALFILEIFKFRFKRANGTRIIYDVMNWLA